MTDYERPSGDAESPPKASAIAGTEGLQVDPGGHDADRDLDPAFYDQPGDTLARGDHAVAEVGKLGREMDRGLPE